MSLNSGPMPADRPQDGDTVPAFLAGDALATGADGRPVLVGGRCGNCGKQTFPRHAVCPACLCEDVAPAEMPRHGTLYSFSTVHVGPGKWHKPFVLGYVDLPNEVRVFTHLKGAAIGIGAEVRLDVAELGREADGSPVMNFVFKPVEG